LDDYINDSLRGWNFRINPAHGVYWQELCYCGHAGEQVGLWTKTMKRLTIRYQRVSDAKRFFEILCHPDFLYFPKPKSLKYEQAFLRKTAEKRKRKLEYNFGILYDDNIVGAVGLKVDQHRKHIGEIGYFVAREHWGKGIAGRAVKLLEQFAFRRLKISRLEIATLRANPASKRVALKCEYKWEGTQRGKQRHNGKYYDVDLFAKVRRIVAR
jgi:ribosomal-protein-alanine N-acetyltransferase